ncbi:channel protein, MIP family [Ancylostoma caninum]|uniref:Channel protein, MIP family n=1 Tax=Ancylostoma caninum TaxID=29170 RepID=A0A368FMZ5_ANCCA|nr:channel protein, MIP family [Ancylostoma caninum]
MDEFRERISNTLRIEDNKLVRELLAETIGTFFLLLIGTAANIQAAASDGGNMTSCHIAWGIGFMFAVYLAASVSGAHLNPAISLAQCVLGNIPMWKVFLYSIAQLIGAYLGTALIGTAANIQAAASDGGNMTSCHIAWGIGFMFAVYLAASVSGAHLNPAISLAQCVLGNIPMWKVFLYSIAQLIGAYLGTAVSYFGHHDDLWKLDGGIRHVTGSQATAGLFATFPSPQMSVWGSLLDQIIGTAILAGLVCLITDKRHKIPPGFVPPLAGAIMSMVAMTFGANGGFAINPARDLGPRLFILCAGYGWEVFSAYGFYFWIPLVGPLIGALIGAWLYKLFVGLHGLNEDLDLTSKGYNDYMPRSQGILIGYDNTLSRTATNICVQRPPIDTRY